MAKKSERAQMELDLEDAKKRLELVRQGILARDGARERVRQLERELANARRVAAKTELDLTNLLFMEKTAHQKKDPRA